MEVHATPTLRRLSPADLKFKGHGSYIVRLCLQRGWRRRWGRRERRGEREKKRGRKRVGRWREREEEEEEEEGEMEEEGEGERGERRGEAGRWRRGEGKRRERQAARFGGCTLVPALERWRQEYKQFTVILGYVSKSRLAQAT